MNERTLFEAITNLDPKFIDEAAELRAPTARRFPRPAIAGIAAAALAIAIVPTALLLSMPASPPIEAETPPASVPGEDGPPIGDGDHETGGPPQISSPLEPGETRVTGVGMITYLAKTDHSVTIRLQMTEDMPVYFLLEGSAGGQNYYASTYPEPEKTGIRIDAFSFTVNGSEGELPQMAGDYEIVVDFTPLCELCDALGTLRSTIADFDLG